MANRIISVIEQPAPQTKEGVMATIKKMFPQTNETVLDVLSNAVTCATCSSSLAISYKGMTSDTAHMVYEVMDGDVIISDYKIHICSGISDIHDDWDDNSLFAARLSRDFIMLYNAASRGLEQVRDPLTGRNIACVGLSVETFLPPDSSVKFFAGCDEGEKIA